MDNTGNKIPPALRTWFVIHFVVDMLFGIPLLLFPGLIMPWFGWTEIDPIMPRLVGAALLGIGGGSLLSRNASQEVFQGLLSLKIIWAAGAILGIGLGIASGGPSLAWIFLAIFGGFLFVWLYYFWKLRRY
jgi:hypothetical protein